VKRRRKAEDGTSGRRTGGGRQRTRTTDEEMEVHGGRLEEARGRTDVRGSEVKRGKNLGPTQTAAC
jgi:hypothetical protein